MKIKHILLLIICLCISMELSAQTVRSYAATGVFSPKGPQSVPPLAMVIEFYDGYFLLNGLEKYVYRTKNYDGSMQFYPATVGNPISKTISILVSKDYSCIRQFTSSIIMGMIIQLIYDYSYIGDGYEPARQYMAIGGYSGGHSHDSNSRDWADCSICKGTGRCKYCGGTGRDEYSRDGRCGVCRGTGRCPGCEGERGYYY